MSNRLIEKRALLKRKHEEFDKLKAEIEELKKAKNCLSEVSKSMNESLDKTTSKIKSNFLDFVENIEVISKNAYMSKSFPKDATIFTIDIGDCVFDEVEDFSGSWFIELTCCGDHVRNFPF